MFHIKISMISKNNFTNYSKIIANLNNFENRITRVIY